MRRGVQKTGDRSAGHGPSTGRRLPRVRRGLESVCVAGPSGRCPVPSSTGPAGWRGCHPRDIRFPFVLHRECYANTVPAAKTGGATFVRCARMRAGILQFPRVKCAKKVHPAKRKPAPGKGPAGTFRRSGRQSPSSRGRKAPARGSRGGAGGRGNPVSGRPPGKADPGKSRPDRLKMRGLEARAFPVSRGPTGKALVDRPARDRAGGPHTKGP